MRTLFAVVFASLIFAVAVEAQPSQAGYWAKIIPDPDTVDWTANDRPGYRYRGMEPTHQRFHAYVCAKRGRGEALSTAENAMIRHLQSLRRWPEAPVPNAFWKEFLRYLREQAPRELNVAQSLMLAAATARGVVPTDAPSNPQTSKVLAYLSSRPFRARNWFERCFGRVEPWMDHYVAAAGVDMRPVSGGPAGGVFPPSGDFNGLRIEYAVSGIALSDQKDKDGFTTWRQYRGLVNADRVTVSGTASAQRGWEGRLTVLLRVGRERQEEQWTFKSPGSQKFSFSVPVARGTDFTFPTSQFSIRLDGVFSLAGAGSGTAGRSLLVSAVLKGDPAFVAGQQAQGDAEWRAHVDKTLRELGYQETPAGLEVTRMRQALAGGDASWRDYVDLRQRELGYSEAPLEKEFDALQGALQSGGPAWAAYVAAPGGATVTPPPATSAAAGTPTGGLPDVGGVIVGTALEQGNLTGAAERFHKTGRVVGIMKYTDLPPNSAVEGLWSRDGAEVARKTLTAGGTGWLSFTLRTQAEGGLSEGTYRLTITVGNTVLGRKTFQVGPLRL